MVYHLHLLTVVYSGSARLRPVPDVIMLSSDSEPESPRKSTQIDTESRYLWIC